MGISKSFSRRDFLKVSSVAGAGAAFTPIVTGCSSSIPLDHDLSAADRLKLSETQFSNPWVTIPANGPLVFVCPRAEMGQGISTGHSALLCEAMDYPLEQLVVKNA